MENKIRLGIIGLGAMGLELLQVAAKHPDFVVTVCSDIDPARVSRAKEEFPNIVFTITANEVIGSSNVDAVYIATPPDFHKEYSIAAFETGKAVFCEKPLTVNLADGEAMVAAAERTKLVNAINFALADRSGVLEIERAWNSGEVGDIVSVEIRLLFPKWPREFQADATWLADRKQGGFIREVFSHFAYLTDRFVGKLDPKYTRLEFPDDGGNGSEIGAFGSIQAGKVNVTVVGIANVGVPETYEWTLFGSKRSYSLRNWGELYFSDGGGWQQVTLSGLRGTEETRLSAFARDIRNGERTLPDFATGLRVAQAVEAFHYEAFRIQSVS